MCCFPENGCTVALYVCAVMLFLFSRSANTTVLESACIAGECVGGCNIDGHVPKHHAMDELLRRVSVR